MLLLDLSRVSCQKGPICPAQAWQIGPSWQETIDVTMTEWVVYLTVFFIHKQYHRLSLKDSVEPLAQY